VKKGSFLLLLALTAVSCGEAPEPSAQVSRLPASNDVDFDTLQVTATAACHCVAEGGDADCWAAYNKSKAIVVERVEAGGGHTGQVGEACAPVSSKQDCFDFSDGEKCISTGFNIVGTARDVCTLDEVEAVETLLDQYPKDRVPSADQLESVFQKVMAGWRPTKKSGGCG